jgi:hypothetical protein
MASHLRPPCWRKVMEAQDLARLLPHGSRAASEMRGIARTIMVTIRNPREMTWARKQMH